MSELEIRLTALQMAMAAEGPKATTSEVLAAAKEILDFVT